MKNSTAPTSSWLKKHGFHQFLWIPLLVCILCSHVNMLHGQSLQASVMQQKVNASITLNAEQQSIGNILEQIEQQSNYVFIYTDEVINKNERQSIQVNDKAVDKVLDELLSGQKIDYQIFGNQIVLSTQKNELRKVESSGGPDAYHQFGQQISQMRHATFTQNKVLEKTITGKVTDATDGTGLPGVNILAQGSTTGTVTDIEGNYRITVPDNVTTLEFSSVGYTTEEVEIGGRTVINISLAPDIKALSEIVVVGYGTQERRDLTGAISSVSSEELNRVPSTSFDAALQGRAPGVLITPNSGQPGGAIDVSIRGVGTFGNNSPLYVIDGVPVFNSISQLSGGIQTNPLSALDPNNIESIEILKDASAAAIYGARAANGVVIISTKRGQEGKPRVTIDGYYGTQWFNNYIDMLDSRQFAEMSTEADLNGGRDPQPAWSDPEVLETNTNWQDAFFNPAPIQDYNVSVSGGSENAKYLFSAGYFGQEGIAPANGFERYSVRVNTDFNLGERIKIGESVSLSRANWRGGIPQGNDRMQELLQSSPTLPVYDPNNLGGFAGPTAEVTGRVNRSNQVAEASLRDIDNRQNRVLGNIYAELDILDGLTYRLNMGLDAIFGEGKNFVPVFELGNRSNPRASLSESSRNENIYLLEHTFTYSKTFNEVHDLTALVGYSQQNSVVNTFSGSVQDFPNNDLRQINAGTGSSSISGDKSEWAIRSWLARINYSFRDKYLFTANFRRDGSSRFGENNRFGNFPSFSVGWRMSEENFMDPVTAVSDLKFRFSWGQVGNQEIGNYSSVATVEPVVNYILGSGQAIAPGAAILSGGNPDLKWETTTQTDIGLELGLFDNRFLVVADYYIKNTTDALLQLPVPTTTGLRRNNGSFVNAAEIRNEGFELALTYRKSTGNFTYNLSANLSTIDNEVVSLGGGSDIIVQRSSDPNIANTITAEGGEIGMFYGWETDGIFQDQSEVDNHATQTPGTAPGDIRYKDLNNDGTINADDRTVLGSAFPDFFYGLNADFGYRGFDLSLFFQGVQGNEIYNLLKAGIQDLEGDNNNMAAVLNRWTGPGTSNTIPRAIVGDPNDNDRPSDRFIEDGSYLRLRNLTFGYTLPSAITDRINLGKVRFYVTGQNLFTITDYSALNPDIGLPQGPGDGERTLVRGVDYGTYPVAKAFLGGIQIEF